MAQYTTDNGLPPPGMSLEKWHEEHMYYHDLMCADKFFDRTERVDKEAELTKLSAYIAKIRSHMNTPTRTPADIQKDIDATWKAIWTPSVHFDHRELWQDHLKSLHKELHDSIEANFEAGK